VAQGKTRATVQAELQAVQRSGDIVADGETGQKLNELYPHRYPAATATAQGKTREQVRAELREAQRTGNIVAGGESGQKLNELYPNRYPAKAMN
jgi:predicted RNase H-like HicB family nuclease